MIWLNQRDNSELNRCNNTKYDLYIYKAMQSALQNVTNIKCITKCDSMLFDNVI